MCVCTFQILLCMHKKPNQLAKKEPSVHIGVVIPICDIRFVVMATFPIFKHVRECDIGVYACARHLNNEV